MDGDPPGRAAQFLETFRTSSLDVARLGQFTRPVLFVLGGRSDPDYYGRMAERAAGMFPDFRLEVFEERHHFDPPHRIEPERTAAMLRAHWARGG